MRPAAFWLLVVIQIWVAHAVGFFVHEYAHSFTAWLVHCKANPLDLAYGQLNLKNILWQSDIDENVAYAPIFAAGRGPLVSLIAVAGVLIGNGSSYIASRLLYTWAKRRKMRGWAMLFFLICVMSVGNFFCYVPVRTFTTHADMANTAQGLNVSPWALILVLGVPFGIALWHFFAKILPDAEAFLFPESLPSQRLLVVLTTYLVFAFFGIAGISGYGSVSHWMSMVSAFVFLPVVAILCWPRRLPARI